MEKNCVICAQGFHVADGDRDFYAKMDVTAPTLCPYCRMQRRYTFRNDMKLYTRTCDKTGKKIISVHPADSEYKVYALDVWWGDSWDPLDYGREFDFSRPFFEQFSELEKAVPHFALFNDGSSENCEYTNYGVENKSCYMAGAAKCEDCYYGRSFLYSKSCVDGFSIMYCELCYDCVDCTKCYNLLFSDNCTGCSDSYFLHNCRNCKNCFGCSELQGKEYYFFNEKLPKEEYDKKVFDFRNNMTHEKIEENKKKSYEIYLSVPHKFEHGVNNENTMGDYNQNCKNVFFGFDCIGLENSSYCVLAGVQTFSLYDCINAGMNCQFLYECVGVVGFNNCIGISFGRYLQDSYYSQNCFNSRHLFGCFGLNRKEYCILNKQYTKEEYEALVSKIIKHMKKPLQTQAPRQGGVEWGEFFPTEISPYAYNETLAQDYFPLTREEVIKKGWKWRDDERSKLFKIVPQELKFYERMGLPVPLAHYHERYLDRLKRRNPYRLWQRTCDKCPVEIWSSYAPDRPEIVYCEKCYLEAVG